MQLKLKPFLWLFLFLFFVNFSFGQTNLQFGERLIVGNSLTYLTKAGRNLDNRLHVLTWNRDISVNLNKALYFGMSYGNYYTKGSVSSSKKQNDNYYSVGLFLQYDFKPKYKNRLYAKVSYSLSNYRKGRNRELHESENPILSLDIGYDFPIHKFISLDLDVGAYKIAYDIFTGQFFFRYSIGINFDFIKKRKKGFIQKNIYK